VELDEVELDEVELDDVELDDVELDDEGEISIILIAKVLLLASLRIIK